MELMIQTEETQQASPAQAQPFERGTRYLIQVRKIGGLPRFCPDFYLKHIFRALRRTEIEDTSIVFISTPSHLLFLTSHIHPEDAERIYKTLPLFEAEVYPIVEDVEQGKPYRGTPCVRTFPNRKSTRLPRVAKYLSHYRWVVYEKVGGEKHGILISEEAPHYTATLASEAYLITYSEADDIVRYTDLTGYRANFAHPLFHSCL